MATQHIIQRIFDLDVKINNLNARIEKLCVERSQILKELIDKIVNEIKPKNQSAWYEFECQGVRYGASHYVIKVLDPLPVLE